MVRHIVMWDFLPSLSSVEIADIIQQLKHGFDLKGKIDGLVNIEFISNFLTGSNLSIMIDCVFSSKESLSGYQAHPRHLEVAKIVRANTTNRRCADFEY